MIEEHDYFYDDNEEMKEEAELKNSQQNQIQVFSSKNFYEVIDQNDAHAKRLSDLNCLMKEFDLGEASALRALKLCQWNYDLALNRLMNDDKFFGLIETTYATDTPTDNTPMTCQSCFSSFEKCSEGFSMSCEHYLCKQCYESYVNVEFDSKAKGSISSYCPVSPCNHLLTDSVFRKFLPTEKYQKLHSYVMRDYIDNSYNLQWCTNPKCSKIVRFKQPYYNRSARPTNVTCECGTCFCSSCKQEGHQPLSCDLAMKWLDLIHGKYRDISDKWIQLNTKRCPKPTCGVPIQKNDGCMHMVCESCRHEFCWLCLGDWAQHNSATGGFYKCNIYIPKDDPEKNSIELDLQKYNFYSERYFEHSKSVQKTISKKRIIMEQFRKICKEYRVDEEGEFLKTALDGIVESRRLLLYTYPLGYFAEFRNKGEKEMFEYQQAQLENHLEPLDELTDYLQIRDTYKFSSAADVLAFKLKVIEMCRGLGQYFSNMMGYFADTFTQTPRDKTPAPIEILSPMKVVAEESETRMEDEGAQQNEQQEQLSSWSCPKCTYHNQTANEACEMCQYSRETPPPQQSN